MLFMMMPIPPIPHGTPMTSSDGVTFWVTIGVVVALVLVATIILGVAGYRSVQRQAQMKKTERHYEASPQPQGGEQPQVHAPEEEKILPRR